jgi:hypothetical protein
MVFVVFLVFMVITVIMVIIVLMVIIVIMVKCQDYYNFVKFFKRSGWVGGGLEEQFRGA